MNAKDFGIASMISDAMRERIERANQPSSPTKQVPGEVVPFPVDRQRRMVDAELRSVREYDNDAAYRWLSRIVKQHSKRLKKFGVAPGRIEADVAALVAAFGIGNRSRNR